MISCERRVVIGGRQSQAPPRQNNVIVIGQEYSDFRDEPEVISSRHVVGSRYSGASSGSSGVVAARTSSGGRGSSSGVVVVGAGFRRKRAVESFLRLIL